MTTLQHGQVVLGFVVAAEAGTEKQNKKLEKLHVKYLKTS